MTEDPLIGEQLDEYRLDALLGQGGMARVYRALDVRLHRWVAVKVIDSPFQNDSDHIMRFEREARAIAQLEHPHIVHLYRYGEAHGLLYMAMQYVEGAPLDRVMASYTQDGQPIEPDEASRIIREIGAALDYAHSRGVIHRDVKPANIILKKQGEAILTDFGLALLADIGTRGEIFGTPHYIAPEQAMSSAGAVPQSDLYALGVILYEMLTGVLPFDAPDALDIAMAHMTEPPSPPRQIRPELSPAVEAVVLKTLAKEPGERYASGAALAAALDRALQAGRQPAAPPSTLSRLSIPERVAVGLAERPLPPLPVSAPAPLPPSPEAPPEPTGTAISPAGRADSQKLLFVGLGAGLVLGVGLVALILVLALLLWLRTRGSSEMAAPPVSPVEVTAVPTKAGQPAPLAAPAQPAATPVPTDTPAQPQLVADTVQDFTTTAGRWQYLWSPPGENQFRPMQYEERKYGACWYAEDYIRICPDSGHPGNGADIAWRWQSDRAGHAQVYISAAKIDPGGDGVVIQAYVNGKVVAAWEVGSRDTQGVTGMKFFETDLRQGDEVMFVMQKNGNVEHDHTAFQAQVYIQ